MLVYPSLDPLQRLDLPSQALADQGLFLTRALRGWYRQHYLGSDADLHDPRLSPGLAQDLRGLPPAFIANAELDPLADEAAHYADRLRQAGISVDLVSFGGMIHGFWVWGGRVPASDHLTDLAAYSLRRYLGRA